MSKWRPNKNGCIYVIPDIHGRINELNIILTRILPLRNMKKYKDYLIFLGDYVDRNQESDLVLDSLIELRDRYKDQVVFIRGNHEEMFLNGIEPTQDSLEYVFWMKYGGDQTLSGYIQRARLDFDNPYIFPRPRIKDIIPKKHLDFLNNNLVNYHEIDNFIFTHGGCDPTRPLSEQDSDNFRWDRSVCRLIVSGYKPTWDKILITGHNTGISKPIFTDKFIMMDSYKELLVLEARSREVFMAKKNKKRLIKYN